MKTGGKIFIASGVLIAAGGIAYFAFPQVKAFFSGTSNLTDHQRLQRKINLIILETTFVTGQFIGRVYNPEYATIDPRQSHSNEEAKKYIFELANSTEKVLGESFENFSYSGLALINDYFIVHVHMQQQINRILNSDEWSDWLNDTTMVHNVSRSQEDVATDVFNSAVNSTGVPHILDGNFKQYWYQIIGQDKLAYQNGKKTELQWYLEFFKGGAGYTASVVGGTGNVGGSSTSGGSGSGTSGGGTGNSGGGNNQGVGIDGDFEQVVDVFCEQFPELCGGDDPTIIDCGPGFHSDATGMCWQDEQNTAGECPEGFFDFGDGRGCVEW